MKIKEVKPSKLWCELGHDETLRAWDLDECKQCGNWESIDTLNKLGKCWTCEKRSN